MQRLRSLVVPLLLVTGCATKATENVGYEQSAIVGGSVPNDQTTSAVVAILREGNKLCTGTLVADNIVLTARHCVSTSNELTVRCTEDGVDEGGSEFKADEPPESLRVFVGPKLDVYEEPAAVGKQVFHTGSRSACDNDLALIVLDRAITDVRPLAVRRYGGVRADERIRSVGFGAAELNVIGERRARDDVRVLAIGATLSESRTALGAREFEASQSFCNGDSGGPAISQAGAVIGVASRGPECSAQDGYVYATTSGFRDLIEKAEKEAGSTIALEPNDDPSAIPSESPEEEEDDDGSADALLDGSTTPPTYGRGLPERCNLSSARPAHSARPFSLLLLLGAVALMYARRLNLERDHRRAMTSRIPTP